MEALYSLFTNACRPILICSMVGNVQDVDIGYQSKQTFVVICVKIFYMFWSFYYSPLDSWVLLLRTDNSSSSLIPFLAGWGSESMLSKLRASCIQRALRPSPLFRSQFVRPFMASRVANGHGLVVHRPADYNDPNMKWEWTEESKKRIEKVLKKFPKNYKQSAVMPLLYIAQEQNDNWLPLAAMNKIAETLDMPPIRVYEVASFYTMYNREPVGKYHIQLCGTTPCMVTGAQSIKQAIMDFAGIKEGETSADGLFTLTEVECLGACVNAPMIQVNNKEFYEFLTPEIMVGIMKDWKAGKTPKAWNQNHVKTCEGPQGKTTLKTPLPEKAPCRDLDALKAELEAAKREAEKDK